MTNPTPVTASAETSRWQHVLHRWPSALGLAAAAGQLATGGNRDSVAIVVGVATLCYLGAAALRRRWVAWAGVAGGSLVVAASELAGLAWWVGLGGVALVLIVAGLLGRAPRPALTAQTAALLGYGGLAVAALYFAPRAGLVLAGVVLAGHAGWDLIHYRRDQVVPRSLAEFCMLLDLPLGVGAIVIAVID
ncbi:hypothetical protein DMB66_33370 [Actinoplanes sp. ATCC 53533]|uniref:hypothetical protein n=1 Tax=Actinoplanes sp. ATCC 53533 TaxID=1288362 RepID=UPI000F767C8E|nr:hypothetical protein [Actinoplanes sp. ATCC 53533]RSM56736.1 hypothetical protein DMB66_33370 [Actinoplanes sp. ATCC 53533]